MGVQDRDWYHEDREAKERDPRTTEYHPKQFRGTRHVKENTTGMHWLNKLIWILCIATWLLAAFVWLYGKK